MSDNLQQLQQQLHLIQSLDRIRDSIGDEADPGAIFTAMCHLLVTEFSADACGIVLLASNDDGIELIACTGMSEDTALILAQSVIEARDKQGEADNRNNLALPLVVSHNDR